MKGDSAMTNKTKKKASIIFNVVRVVPKVVVLGMTFRKEGCLLWLTSPTHPNLSKDII